MAKFEHNGQEYYIDGYLKDNLEVLKTLVAEKDNDNTLLVDGGEGGGKSLFTETIATFLDPTYNIDRCCFTPDQLFKAVLAAKKGQCVVYDEAYWGASAMGAVTERTRAYINLLTQIRCKNLHMIVVAPSFFDLQKYIAVWRSRALCHVYLGSNLDRGYFSFYNAEKKQRMYFLGRKFYTYCVKPNFRGRFTAQRFLDKDQYDSKKLASFEQKLEVGNGKRELTASKQRNALVAVTKHFYPDLRHQDIDTFLVSLGLAGNSQEWLHTARKTWPELKDL